MRHKKLACLLSTRFTMTDKGCVIPFQTATASLIVSKWIQTTRSFTSGFTLLLWSEHRFLFYLIRTYKESYYFVFQFTLLNLFLHQRGSKKQWLAGRPSPISAGRLSSTYLFMLYSTGSAYRISAFQYWVK